MVDGTRAWSNKKNIFGRFQLGPGPPLISNPKFLVEIRKVALETLIYFMPYTKMSFEILGSERCGL